MLKLFQVDAFTDTAFRGNPAAVCFLDRARPDDWMKDLAREMNLSETAFLLPEGPGYRLRWFTPKKEVSLCGHATLASAHVLFERGFVAIDETAVFETLSGRLTAAQKAGWITLDFPARAVEAENPPEGLLDALGLKNPPVFVGRHKQIYLLELESEDAVLAAQPDFAALAVLPVRSVIITTRAQRPGFDLISRYFAPAIGVNEDPVTGAAHCALAWYWHHQTGQTDWNAFQASERGGVLRVHLRGERVLLEGQAVTVFAGDLLVE